MNSDSCIHLLWACAKPALDARLVQLDLFHLLPFVRASFSCPRRLIAAASKSLTLPASMSFQPAPTSARSLA